MHAARHCRSDATGLKRPRTKALFEVVAFLGRAGEVARQRRALLRLGDTALKDFGASRADAWNEASRPWWDLPKDC